MHCTQLWTDVQIQVVVKEPYSNKAPWPLDGVNVTFNSLINFIKIEALFTLYRIINYKSSDNCVCTSTFIYVHYSYVVSCVLNTCL